jgi:hypothetical protein
MNLQTSAKIHPDSIPMITSERKAIGYQFFHSFKSIINKKTRIAVETKAQQLHQNINASDDGRVGRNM